MALDFLIPVQLLLMISEWCEMLISIAALDSFPPVMLTEIVALTFGFHAKSNSSIQVLFYVILKAYFLDSGRESTVTFTPSFVQYGRSSSCKVLHMLVLGIFPLCSRVRYLLEMFSTKGIIAGPNLLTHTRDEDRGDSE
ncbi:hypothetical protein QAD02_005703 [Eretmocerus hayati]|uniref:Uncharacterized protein n=1 Tax=Eretmocerus hayati TaxID=131215 RepID=A0ACC2NV02_9HYME|nr:hypothetical protein QAD02_005703 [Eretmocerus hayati]